MNERKNLEEVELHGFDMYDSVARWQYSLIPRFSTIDPLAEKYYHLSPYAYCAGDPVNLVDPDGRKWETVNDENIANEINKEAEKKLNKIRNKLIKAQKSLNKRPYSEKRQSKLNRLKQQEELLVSFIDGLGQLTASSNTYTFINLGGNHPTNSDEINQNESGMLKNGFLYKHSSGKVDINYVDNSSNIYHETQHAIQYESGEFGIDKSRYSNTKREQVWGFEEEAYKVEYLLGTLFRLKFGVWKYNNINTEWVKSLGY